MVFCTLYILSCSRDEVFQSSPWVLRSVSVFLKYFYLIDDRLVRTVHAPRLVDRIVKGYKKWENWRISEVQYYGINYKDELYW